MKDVLLDYQKERTEWRRKGWSIPDLRGGKQSYYSIVLGALSYVDSHNSCGFDDDITLPELNSNQKMKAVFPFLKGVGLLKKRKEFIVMTDVGEEFIKNPSKIILANLIHDNYRLFGEILNVLADNRLTVAEVDQIICREYGLNWVNLSNTRKRMDWLEVLDLIQSVGNNKWEITEQGRQTLNNWCLISPEAVESMNVDDDEIIIQEAPDEISSLLIQLSESPDLHNNRNTYNIWVPSPNRIDNLYKIIRFSSERVTRSELFQFIENEFSLKTSSAESMMPFLKASGLIEEVGRNIYISTSAAKAWIDSENDLDLIRILHIHMRFVGEMIKAAENDIVRNDLYEQAKLYGLNTEKARWIAGFLIEAGLMEEPQYLHLKATSLGKAFVRELPLAELPQNTDDSEGDADNNLNGKNINLEDPLEIAISSLLHSAVDPILM